MYEKKNEAEKVNSDLELMTRLLDINRNEYNSYENELGRDQPNVSFSDQDVRITDEIFECHDVMSVLTANIGRLTDELMEISEDLELISDIEEKYGEYEELGLELLKLFYSQKDYKPMKDVLIQTYSNTFGDEMIDEDEEDIRTFVLEMITKHRSEIHDKKNGIESEMEEKKKHLKSEKIKLNHQSKKLEKLKMRQDALAGEMERYARRKQLIISELDELELEGWNLERSKNSLRLEHEALLFELKVIEIEMKYSDYNDEDEL